MKLLAKECHLLKIDNKISESVKVQLDDNQREYYLKERLKAIYHTRISYPEEKKEQKAP